ncbi:hypothetical protein T02_9231 [Trichinella nativa]|uniref:Uncharacterized protein n=1 Tax=Trichinella nativa TaxID=6335 RepID=A0A0V1KUX3_9BILA|nr:hypothetical protein T02_9231 [Trichinella nativa]
MAVCIDDATIFEIFGIKYRVPKKEHWRLNGHRNVSNESDILIKSLDMKKVRPAYIRERVVTPRTPGHVRESILNVCGNKSGSTLNVSNESGSTSNVSNRGDSTLSVANESGTPKKSWDSEEVRPECIRDTGDITFKCLPYQPSMVVYATTMGSTPEREPEKRLPHPRKAAGAQITHSQLGEKRYRNEYALHTLTSSNWRASLVPAAAVIPAPIAQQSPYIGVARLLEIFIRGCCCCSSLSVNGASRFYFEKIRVLKAEYDLGSILLVFEPEIMIERNRRGHSYCCVRERKLEVRRRSDTALVLTVNYANQRFAEVHLRLGEQLPGNQSVSVPGEELTEGHHQEWSLRLNLTQHGKTHPARTLEGLTD